MQSVFLDIPLDIPTWECPDESWVDEEKKVEYPTLGNYNSKYKPSEVNYIFKSLEKYLNELINNKEVKEMLIDNVAVNSYLEYVEGNKINKEPIIQINDYIIFDKDIVDIVYYHGRHKSFMNEDYFTDRGCRIINTEGSFNFQNFKKVCISEKGDVLWGLFIKGNNRYMINKDIIPQINTRKGKIKMVLNGL